MKDVIIFDTTSLIHANLEELEKYGKYDIIIPESVQDELKSRIAFFHLALIKASLRPMFVSPSKQSIKTVEKIAKKTGDLTYLSKTDVDVIALAFEYKNAVVVSDDKAIQNVCQEANIQYKPLYFKIRKKRHYFWKCIVCGKKFDKKVKVCLDCGSPVKRYYRQKQI